MTQPAGEIVGIACSIWAKELEALARNGRVRFPVRYFDSLLHLNPERMRGRLHTMLEEELAHGRRVLLIVGDCHAGMCEMEDRPGVARVRGVNCCEILLGKAEYAKLLGEGAFFLLPDWTRRWRAVFREALGLDEKGLRTLMGEMVKRLVYLDTGLVRIPLEHLKAASAFTGIPYEVVGVGLDYLAGAVEEAVMRLVTAAGEPPEAAGPRFPALSVMTLDILRNALALSERTGEMAAYVTEELRELTGAKTVLLMRSGDENGAECQTVSVCPQQRAHLAADPMVQELAGRVANSPGQVETREPAGEPATGIDMGLPLRAGGETVGVLLLLELPEARAAGALKDALTMLSAVMALVLRNALLHEGQERTIRLRTQELAKSEARLQLALESADEALWEWNTSSPDVYFSARIFEMLGLESGSGMLPLETWQSLLHPEDRENVRREIRGHLAEGDERRSMQYRMLSAGGRYRWYEASAKVVQRGADGSPAQLIGTLRDITAQRELEEQLRQSLKMEAVGRLAGGVAHDFNNLLTVITGYSSLLLRGLGATSPHRPYVEEISKAGDRARSLTQQLLAFSRKQIIEPRPVDLNAEVRNMHDMLRRLIGEHIAITTALDPELGMTLAGPDQVHQIIMNLVVNARDAMPQGGNLTIATANARVAAAGHPDRSAGDFVVLTVADTGVGIDENTQRNIFEPFFTTKEVGKGTGLGLSSVYGSVRQSGGWVEVESEPGEGAAFRVFLPRIDVPPAVARNAASSAAAAPTRETILVVEDQEQVRRLAADVLQASGYEVLEAADGDSAVLAAQQHAGPIHVLLSDLVLPDMSGPEVAGYVQALRPKVRVICMSGYTQETVRGQGALDRDVAYLAKPFSPDGLIAKVREVLASPPDGA